MRLILTLLLLLPLTAGANSPSAAQLNELRQRIGELEKALRSDVSQRDAEQAALREVELRLSRLNRQHRTLEQRRREAAAELERLEARQARLAVERGVQLEWVGRTARAGYMHGRQELVRMLLNQEQPDNLARLLRYQEYFQRARQERVSLINRDLDELLEAVAATEAARQELDERQAELEQQRISLASARQERSTALANINKRIGSSQQNLERLRQDERRLNTLLKDVGQTISDIPATPAGVPFGNLANKLPWPVPRRISARFGSPREGSIRWNGVLLDAPAGTPVRAIHGGRVVFADWLRGYGLLIILDHGGSYLSLYGQNQSLNREVGEWVATGDVIAQVGDSGGNNQAGLYFEIRRAGVPVNPDQWCNSRVTLPPIASRQ
jgi:murein hydrolase activator